MYIKHLIDLEMRRIKRKGKAWVKKIVTTVYVTRLGQFYLINFFNKVLAPPSYGILCRRGSKIYRNKIKHLTCLNYLYLTFYVFIVFEMLYFG